MKKQLAEQESEDTLKRQLVFQQQQKERQKIANQMETRQRTNRALSIYQKMRKEEVAYQNKVAQQRDAEFKQSCFKI